MNQSRRKKRKRNQKEADETLSLADRITIIALFAGILAVLLVGAAVVSRQHNQQALEAQLKRWRVDYQLNDEQIARIRLIESEFHGSGNIFTRPSRTLQDARDHHRAIAEMMSPANAQRFLKGSEGGFGAGHAH